jgi:hypothetical protein
MGKLDNAVSSMIANLVGFGWSPRGVDKELIGWLKQAYDQA